MSGVVRVNTNGVEAFFSQYFAKVNNGANEARNIVTNATRELTILGSQSNDTAQQLVAKIGTTNEKITTTAQSFVATIQKCSQRFLLEDMLIHSQFTSSMGATAGMSTTPAPITPDPTTPPTAPPPPSTRPVIKSALAATVPTTPTNPIIKPTPATPSGSSNTSDPSTAQSGTGTASPYKQTYMV